MNSGHNKTGVSQKGQVVVLGIDLSKKSFQLHGVDAKDHVVIKKKLNRKALLPFIANLPECIIAIEACGGSHYWCRKFTELGHQVRIIAPQFVKPYVKSNKNDAADAEAICEAAQRPNMRFVPSKDIEQQDIQSIHRIRSQAVARRTALGNQIRGLLMEYGVIIPKGISFIRKQIPLVLEDAENGLTVLFRELLNELYEEMVHLDNRIEKLELKLETIATNSKDCQLLLTIPGVGLLSATALLAAIGDISAVAVANKNARIAWAVLSKKEPYKAAA